MSWKLALTFFCLGAFTFGCSSSPSDASDSSQSDLTNAPVSDAGASDAGALCCPEGTVETAPGSAWCAPVCAPGKPCPMFIIGKTACKPSCPTGTIDTGGACCPSCVFDHPFHCELACFAK